MNTFLRSLSFLSAFAPAAVVAGAMNWFANGLDAYHITMVAVGAIGCLFPFIIIAGIAKQSETLSFQAKKVESQDWLVVAFIMTYFAPIFFKTTDYTAFLTIAVAAALVLAAIQAIPCHPVLQALRYRFYKVEASNGMVYILISRRQILKASDISTVHQISSDMLLEA